MRATLLLQRALGVALLVLVLFPWYRWIGARATGPAAQQALRLGGPYLTAVWIGCAVGLVGAVALTRLLPRRLAPVGARMAAALLAPAPAAFAAGAGVVAAALALWVGLAVLDGQPVLLDAISQLVHGRYLAAGRLAGPILEDPAFWQFQFMVLSDAGWASQYPPGFPAALALAERAGAVWLLGPALLGCAVFMAGLIADRMFSDDPLVGRVGTGLLALSPFLAFHAATYMSHVLALALVALAVLAALRAWDGWGGWAVVGGAAVGALIATRPYTGVVTGLGAAAVGWMGARAARPLGRGAWQRRVGGALLGATPFVAALLWFNRRVFGAATRFGYVAAEGPAHGLGFHVDPWGDPYGLSEAVGYTSADLQSLSVDLLQSTVPVVVVVALHLLLAPRLSRGARVAAAWALLPVAAQAFYWHHDLFMGPRLLYEAAPGWCFLAAAAAIGLVRALPEDAPSPAPRPLLSRGGLAGMFALALALALVTAPAKLASYRAVAARSGMTVTAPPVDRPSLVFVHGGWEDRVAARLAASGLRVDSVRALLTRHSTCRLERHLEEGAPLDGGVAPALRALPMPSGSVIRSFEGEALAPSCARQAASDFGGIVGLPPLLWRGDLPGLESSGPMFVRDLGPEHNRRLIDRFREREPRVLTSRDGSLRLLPYAEGMSALWSG